MKLSTAYRQHLDAKGIPLQELGIRDIGLERDDALLAIEILGKDSIPILGGDVYVKRGATIEPAYANWHSDPRAGESKEDYLKRSWTSTETYIRSYPEPSSGKPLFILVVGE